MIQEMETEIAKKLFTVDEFYRMSEAGILPEDKRYELIRGEIIEMPPPGPPHAGRVNRLNRLFMSKLGDSVVVSVQNPFFVDIYSLPIPDVALLKARADFYQTAHPGAEDVLLLVEVSHTTVNYDAKVKAPVYGECEVPEYWQLDIAKDALIVRTDPKDGNYTNVRTMKRGETITPQRIPTVSFSIDEILG